jgi:prepilin-type N-terminal cleavage/methylation domain-containing protein
MIAAIAARLRERDQDEGFTLVEMLVTIIVFSVVMVAVMTTVLTASRSVSTVKQVDDANEEARLALVRISRELRQATAITGATLFTTGTYAGTGYASSITLNADFNGDGVIEPDAPDAEVLTYRFVPDPSNNGNGQIQLEANDPHGTLVVRPILAAHVSDFHMELRSSQWACDSNGDGITTWQELDTNASATCPHPDGNGTLDTNELASIDSVFLNFSVFEGTHRQTYNAQVNLRNVGVSNTSGN